MTTSANGKRPYESAPHEPEVEALIAGSVLGPFSPPADHIVWGTDPAWFWVPKYRETFAAAAALRRRGERPEPLVVADELHRAGHAAIITRTELVALQTEGTVASMLPRYITILGDKAWARACIETAFEIREAGANGDRARADTAITALRAQHSWSATRSRLCDGATWILSEPDDIPAVWGDGDRVLWARGESTLIVGPAGVGKTTLAQRVTLALIGINTTVLGFPVSPIDEGHRVLYIAADRPRQAARSMKRMVTAEDTELLQERLAVWPGPLPFDLRTEPARLADFAREHHAAVIVIDSLKDVAPELSSDETGSRVNHALQTCLADGIDVLALHHQRKAGSDGKKPTSLADVYGSTWITAGAGSVVLVWGQPGDALVDLAHLKQPGADVGPLRLRHDHATGDVDTDRGFDALAFLRTWPTGATALDAARARFVKDAPKENEVEKARRELESLIRKGLAHRIDGGTRGGAGGTAPHRYVLTIPDPK